jgi:broad specificity phosphatase PhoE
MKKPKFITVIRHGLSGANVDKNIYVDVPDYAVTLAPQGLVDVEQAAKQLAVIFPDDIDVYCSTYFRTKQTLEIIQKFKSFRNVQFDPRLREQEWGNKLGEGFNYEHEKERRAYGHFYWRYANGESCADVYNRVCGFITDLFINNTAENVLIVGHGMTNRVIMMRLLNLTVEQFEMLANPKNAEYAVLSLDENQNYNLISEKKLYDAPTHPFQYSNYPLPNN